MPERILFLTGHLAEARLQRELSGMGETGFEWEVVNIGVKVAALMTEQIILRRLKRPLKADRVLFPGRAGVDPGRLSEAFGVPFERGPDEIADLPRYLGHGGREPDLSRHDTTIFAEIVEAPQLTKEALLARARKMRDEGADVIDLGCQPGRRFPHLEESIRWLKHEGFRVSVDSGNAEELRRGAVAGADFVLSLTEATLDVVKQTEAVPVLIPSAPGDLESLVRAIAAAERRGLRYIADPVLDPIHFGFTASLCHYRDLRERLPDVEMLMGTGNLTELTDADSSGVTVLLMGVCSELGIRNVLVVQVSAHTRRTVAEHDFARRLMYAARGDHDLPRGYGRGLLQIHDRHPYAFTTADIAEEAGAIRDANFRIVTAEDGIHVFSSRVHEVRCSAMELFPTLQVEGDGAHAFYLGTELARAEIAFRLGKRFSQDEPLDWGCAETPSERDRTRLVEAGHTLRTRQDDKPDDS